MQIDISCCSLAYACMLARSLAHSSVYLLVCLLDFILVFKSSKSECASDICKNFTRKMKCDLIWYTVHVYALVSSFYIFDDVYLYVPIDGGFVLLMVISFSVPTSSVELVHLPPKKTLTHTRPHGHAYNEPAATATAAPPPPPQFNPHVTITIMCVELS